MIPKRCDSCGQIVEENNIHRFIILGVFVVGCIFLLWVGLLVDKVYFCGVL